ncbi:MAG: YjdF family protein [Ethanoligenens sp.]
MSKIESKLTVFFEEPFWVGVYERISDGKLEVCKITFGSEPKDYEVYEFFLKNWSSLRFSPPVKASESHTVKANPKRMQREIQKQLGVSGVGTKAQEALRLQHEANKTQRLEKSKQQKDAEKQLQFELHQQKRKEKHKGR